VRATVRILSEARRGGSYCSSGGYRCRVVAVWQHNGRRLLCQDCLAGACCCNGDAAEAISVFSIWLHSNVVISDWSRTTPDVRAQRHHAVSHSWPVLLRVSKVARRFRASTSYQHHHIGGQASKHAMVSFCLQINYHSRFKLCLRPHTLLFKR
jgi:hypothetical protein